MSVRSRRGSLLERVAGELGGVNGAGVEGAEEDHGRHLQQADLERIGGTDFHRQCDIAIHGE